MGSISCVGEKWRIFKRQKFTQQLMVCKSCMKLGIVCQNRIFRYILHSAICVKFFMHFSNFQQISSLIHVFKFGLLFFVAHSKNKMVSHNNVSLNRITVDQDFLMYLIKYTFGSFWGQIVSNNLATLCNCRKFPIVHTQTQSWAMPAGHTRLYPTMIII